jgi:hypothetical protein
LIRGITMNFRALLRCVFALAIVVAFVVPIFADTIRLKDGSTIKGRITGFTGGKFTVAVGEGNRRREFTFSAGEIESIEFDRSEVLDRNVSAVNSSVKTDRPVADEPIVTEKPVSVPAPKTTQATNYNPSRGLIKPVAINVNVLADSTSNGWTNSGWVVKKGQRIRITAEGEVALGKGQKSGPGGQYSLEDEKKLLKSVPTGALIAVIGDDNNDFIYIGTDREFVATRDGTLFLGLNEGNLDDNSGSFKVKVEISPES